MSIPEDLSAQLPTPRADEPATLRQNIADEIADHLHCAARREHLQNSGSGPLTDQAALAAAIERFGEPAAIARRLWWDAMKERIMAQRILTIMATTAAAAAVFACFVLWQATQTSRAEQTALLQSQQSVMTAMLAELKSTQKADDKQWQTLKVRLVDEQGRPVIGKVSCTGQGNQTSDSTEAKSDGVAEFYLPPGQYIVGVTVGSTMTTLTQLLPPGRPTTRTVVCPGQVANTIPLRFALDKSNVPADLNIYYVAQLQLMSRQVADQQWIPAPFLSTSGERYLISPQGELIGQLPDVPERAVTSNSPGMNPKAMVFPKRIPAGTKLRAPAGLQRGTYYTNVAPYVPDPPPAGSAELPEAADAMPALRSVWYPGGSTQVIVDTQVKDFGAISLDEIGFHWTNLRSQIAAGTPEAPYEGYPSAPSTGATYVQPPVYLAPPASAYPQPPSAAPPSYQPPAASVPPQDHDNTAPQVPPPSEEPDKNPPNARIYLLPQKPD